MMSILRLMLFEDGIITYSCHCIGWIKFRIIDLVAASEEIAAEFGDLFDVVVDVVSATPIGRTEGGI